MNFSKLIEKYRQDHQHPVNKLTHAIGIPMIVISLPWFFFDWKTALGLFVIGWIFQFVGHWFEGKKPSFFSNPAFLIVGPVYFLRKLFGKEK
jgi:uncharacterized membrane protein YGL010W